MEKTFNIIKKIQQKNWINGFDSITLRQLDNIIKDIQDGKFDY